MKPIIVTIDNDNKETAKQLFIKKWGGEFMVSRGQIHNFNDLDGFVAIENDKIAGVLTFKKSNNEIEMISLDSLKENAGIGTALLNTIIDFAKYNSIKRLWLITTNDNLNALRFYQKRNWTITAIHKDAILASRKIKSTIPLTGYYDIPLRHEIELEYEFS